MKTIIMFFVLTFTALSIAKSNWTPAGEMSAGNTDLVRALAFTDSGIMYASSWGTGIYKSTNRGMNWTFSGLQGKRVTTLSASRSGDVYGLSKTQDFSYIHRTTDNGNTWTDVFTGSFPLNFAGGGEIVFPSDGSIVAAFSVTVGPTIGDVSAFVFKSTDSGNTWAQTQVIGAGFAGGMIITGDERILLGTSLGGVKYSTNNGSNFSNFSTFPPIFIKTILKADPQIIYVSDAYGLNRSTDNGLTFTDIGSHSNGVTLRTACVNRNGDLFIGMDDRNVYYSDDLGDSWKLINEGLPAGSYFNVLISADGKIYGGTNNRGVMIYDIPTHINSGSEITGHYNLSQNYPNPFNPSTVIRYTVPESNDGRVVNVKLIIYDILGNEVEAIVNEKQSGGTYSVKFDGGNLAAGIYFYKLIADKYSSVRKMILLK